jgi:oligopeptide transport system ATP-binding protein
MNAPLLIVKDLCVDFGTHAALSDVHFELFAGETLGLVGESGSGKSTLARAILRLLRPIRGSVQWLGRELTTCSEAQLRAQRRDLQIVFQDPLASLNPRMSAGDAIAEPLKIFQPQLDAKARQLRIAEMLARVGLEPAMAARYPHEFSAGQCQRIGIARAMILGPKLLVCDEPVSSLDVSIQGQIINLLIDLQRDVGTAMLFISHNLAVVRHLSHRVLVIYRGRMMESAACDALFAAPKHPYTRALMAAVPSIAHSHAALPALPAAGASARPSAGGCVYRERCPFVLPICASMVPPLGEVSQGHWVACHRSHEALFPLSLSP